MAIVFTAVFGTVNHAQPFAPGDTSPNFTLVNRETGQNVSLTDFEGQIIVLDFFAYWCAPCSVSSPDIEKNIQKYYAERGGNPHGVPVQVLAMNLEREAPENTDAFVESAGLEIVVNDFESQAWDFYNLLGPRPSIPLFVIINGVANSPNHEQWEVLHSQHGMYILPGQTTAKLFRSVIDEIEPGPELEERRPNPFDTAPTGRVGWKTSEWFGRLNDVHFPWVFQERLSWLYVARRSTAADFYFYHATMGWLYTSQDLYPKAYSFPRTAWIYFDDSNLNPGRFFDYSAGAWIDISSTPESPIGAAAGRAPNVRFDNQSTPAIQ